MTFDGTTYSETRDRTRLMTCLKAVEACLQEGGVWTPSRLQNQIWIRYGVKASESGITARIRDLRKPRFGGYRIDAGSIGAGGTWGYTMVLGEEA